MTSKLPKLTTQEAIRLNLADIADRGVGVILRRNSPGLTRCPTCQADEFVHEDGCELAERVEDLAEWIGARSGAKWHEVVDRSSAEVPVELGPLWYVAIERLDKKKEKKKEAAKPGDYSVAWLLESAIEGETCRGPSATFVNVDHGGVMEFGDQVEESAIVYGSHPSLRPGAATVTLRFEGKDSAEGNVCWTASVETALRSEGHGKGGDPKTAVVIQALDQAPGNVTVASIEVRIPPLLREDGEEGASFRLVVTRRPDPSDPGRLVGKARLYTMTLSQTGYACYVCGAEVRMRAWTAEGHTFDRATNGTFCCANDGCFACKTCVPSGAMCQAEAEDK